ncbi:7 transmembrane sweet-taste receptor of 3 GCPR-domain-containing protein [Catenaria anguillulae PL171]|uniref:7 transmembrane sweet-taste receptor of 3 GCPR-domain-containing protein n=1 Tax=Catenaria anguillulae PL171 TaxID=765915 RepID=A0A1Y2HEX2_9FUNG|nr:7 transmembrane sweet-taste receptor of 3 GCPR-domain-containing protein [Catenaria anguillulae PL171]
MFAECAAQSAYGCVGYYWRPEALPSTSNLSEIKLPAYSDDCWSRLNTTNPNPDAYLACDWTIDIIHKIGNAGMRQWAPHVSTFFKLQSLRETDVNTLLADYATRGKLAEETACRWLKANPVLWKGWIPPPPANYIRFLDSLSMSEPITILVFVLCAISYILAATLLGYLVKFAKSPSVRAQSPPFMAVILFGCTVITTSIVLEPLPASTSTCATRTWLLSLGMCTVLAAIILKTARIFWIFGNKKMRVMSGQLKTNRLMLAVACVVLVDAILLGVWTAVAGPTQTVLDVTTTTFTYVCGSTSTADGATAISVITMVYHALLLVTAVYLSYKVRNVATEFNESRWIALSSYQILLACILVLPVVYLPINFRAQVAIKCLMILCVVLGVMGGLVARAVVEAALAASAGNEDPMAVGGSAGGIGFGKFGSKSTATPSILGGKPTARGASAAPLMSAGDSTNKSTGGLAAGGGGAGPSGPVMYGVGFSMRKLAGYLRRWTEHDLTLVGGAKPALILTDLSHKSPQSKAYTVLVYARVLDDADKAKFPGCFLLAIEATKYLVQANDAAEAAQWVAAVSATFEAVNAAHSRGRITSTSGHGAQDSSAAVRSVTASQVAGMVMQGGGMGNA